MIRRKPVTVIDEWDRQEKADECLQLVRAWMAAQGWPVIDGELVLELTLIGRKRIMRVRPADPVRLRSRYLGKPVIRPGAMLVYTVKGTLLGMVAPSARDADTFQLPREMLLKLVRVVD